MGNSNGQAAVRSDLFRFFLHPFPFTGPVLDLGPGLSGGDVLAFAVGDFDGDGQQDLVVLDSGRSTLRMHANRTGQGDFSSFVDIPVLSAVPHAPLVVDLNGDGSLDVVVIESTGMLVALGDGRGGFPALARQPVAGRLSALSVADVNRDQRPDLIGLDTGTGTVETWLNQGRGELLSASRIAVESSYACLAVADVDGDQVADVALTSLSSNQVSVQLGDGRGGLARRERFSPGIIHACPALGDWNRDGRSDVLLAGQSLPGVSNSLLLRSTAP